VLFVRNEIKERKTMSLFADKKLSNYLPTVIRIVCIIFCVYFVLNILFFDTYSLAEYLAQKSELKRLDSANDKLLEMNKQSETEIDKLQNDPFYIEGIARKNYSMVKRGETVYIFRQQ
jgi:cell division protein FtsB